MPTPTIKSVKTNEDFGDILSGAKFSVEAFVVVGGTLLWNCYNQLKACVSRGISFKILFPDPTSLWLAPMVSSAGVTIEEYRERITRNAERANNLGPNVEVRWYMNPATKWFVIVDRLIVASKPIDFMVGTSPVIERDQEILLYYINLFDKIWTSSSKEPQKFVIEPSAGSVIDTHPKREEVATFIQDKIVNNEFDVFLCHNNVDKSTVKDIGRQLIGRGILPWLDEWNLRPGLPWQDTLEKQIDQIKTAAVFVGENGVGPWQRSELNAFLREFNERGCPVIPVLLANAPQKPNLPIFLKGMTWVDFRRQEPNPMEQLMWGITGERGKSDIL